VVANGVDASSIRFTPPTERRKLRERLRIPQPLALFVGSWHEPNLLAARQILQLARRLPNVRFGIAGGVGIPLATVERPSNVELFGNVSEELKDALLGVAEVALNPMLSGSGTNMKMLDYMAAGIPVISTEVGARGLGLELGLDVRVAQVSGFGEAVRAVLDEVGETADPRARATRRKIQERFDWKAIAAPLVATIGQGDEAAAQENTPRSAISA
jgi:glycosyltransferase involved in cell wall biosynthesis